MSCKGLCDLFVPVSVKIGEKLYQKNIKFCTICEKRMRLDGYRCKCCHSSVRSQSHHMEWKNKTRSFHNG